MPERVVRFGPEHSIVGILALPHEPTRDGRAVVLLNSGIIHRVGSSRLYVELARAIAACGVPVLRFDLSGIGDSRRRPDATHLREAIERDIDDAITYLANHHDVSRVVLMGLCSGAFDAFAAAVADRRVTGAFMVDMPGPFRVLGHTARHIAARFFRPASWRNPLGKLWRHSRRVLSDAMVQRPDNGAYIEGARGPGSRERMAEQLDVLLARGTRLHFVFTAGLEENYNHPGQFRATFPAAARHPALTTAFFPEPDHSFGTRAMRERLVRQAVDWITTTPREMRTMA